MINPNEQEHRSRLQIIAKNAMLKRGLLPEFSAQALAQLDRIHAPASVNEQHSRDMRDRLWCSIDNDDSMDLDQLTVAEALPGDQARVWVAIADVDGLVKKKSAIDGHASYNTTSVYTAAQIFPMLPERLSTDLTSLSFNTDRLAMVVEFVVNADGSIHNSSVYPAQVHNYAKLAYNHVAAWLEGTGLMPEGISAVTGLDENLRLQDRIAQSLKSFRQAHGALSLETVESKPVFDGNTVRAIEFVKKNRARELIEDLMIAANEVSVRFLTAKNFPSIHRVVRTPERWDRIVDVVAQHGGSLPKTPDSSALEAFLVKARQADALRFPDLCLAIIKLMGAGEYVAELPGDPAPGHFGLAVKDYTHSTAPNRRFADLITQRLLKAAQLGGPLPYAQDELITLATHCTQQEDAVNKVERQVTKSAAALLLEDRIGERFDAIVTGAAPKGTWVRLLTLPVEGKLVAGFIGLDVGDRLNVQLMSVDVEQGFIDFKRADLNDRV
jgi:VacB/RNase II family 3'-5' exoribonuclease